MFGSCQSYHGLAEVLAWQQRLSSYFCQICSSCSTPSHQPRWSHSTRRRRVTSLPQRVNIRTIFRSSPMGSRYHRRRHATIRRMTCVPYGEFPSQPLTRGMSTAVNCCPGAGSGTQNSRIEVYPMVSGPCLSVLGVGWAIRVKPAHFAANDTLLSLNFYVIYSIFGH
jgi:hypothetical protein